MKQPSIKCRYNKKEHKLLGKKPDAFKRCNRIAKYGRPYDMRTKPATWYIFRCSDHANDCCSNLPKKFKQLKGHWRS